MTYCPTRRGLLKAGLSSAALSAADWRRIAAAQSADGLLRIGMGAPNTTMDPHLQSNAPNNAVAMHIFDSLVTNDEKSQSKPGLAVSWKTIDDTHWEFTLRDGVAF